MRRDQPMDRSEVTAPRRSAIARWSNRPVVVAAGHPASARAALRWAAEEAALRGVRLVITTSRKHDCRGEGEAFVAALATARKHAPGVEVHAVDPDARSGEPEEVATNAGLLVLSAAEPAMAATVAEAFCPVVVVPEADPPRFGPVVLAAAPWTAEGTIELAFHEAAARAARLDAVRIWFDPAVSLGLPTPGSIAAFDAAAGKAGRELDGALAAWSADHPDVEVRRIVIEDDTVAALLALAHGAQLMVLGRSVRGLALAAKVNSPPPCCATRAARCSSCPATDHHGSGG